MPSPTFALIQDGSLTGASAITQMVGVVARQHQVVNTTNTASGQSSEYSLGRFFYNLSAQGVYTVGGNYPLPIGTAVSNGPIGRLSRIRLVKRQVITNVTAADDGADDAEFSIGTISYFGRGMGYLQSTETPLGDSTGVAIADFELTAFTIPLSTTASVAASAKIRNMRKRYNFTKGGPPPVEFDFVLSGTVTLTGTVPFTDQSFSGTLVADNGETWTGTVKYRELETDIDYENGVPTMTTISGPFSGSPAVVISDVV